jgi:hypothetical protein
LRALYRLFAQTSDPQSPQERIAQMLNEPPAPGHRPIANMNGCAMPR